MEEPGGFSPQGHKESGMTEQLNNNNRDSNPQESECRSACPTLCDPVDCSPWKSPGQNTGVGSLSLLQGIFPTQESTRGLLHCRWILNQLS